MDEWIKKLWYINTIEYYSAIKKEFLPFVTTWMNLKALRSMKYVNRKKDKYYMISLILGILKQNNNEIS